MPDLNDYLERDKREIADLFVEDVALSLASIGRHATFSVREVDGVRVAHDITVERYYDQQFLPFSMRDPSDRLVLVDRDATVRCGQVVNHANIELRLLHPHASSEGRAAGLYVPHGTRLSIRDLLARAYRLGGYGARHDLANSDAPSAASALALAGEALGTPPSIADEASMLRFLGIGPTPGYVDLDCYRVHAHEARRRDPGAGDDALILDLVTADGEAYYVGAEPYSTGSAVLVMVDVGNDGVRRPRLASTGFPAADSYLDACREVAVGRFYALYSGPCSQARIREAKAEGWKPRRITDAAKAAAARSANAAARQRSSREVHHGSAR